MSKHRTFEIQTSQKTEQFVNIKLYVPRPVWSHNNRTELRTLTNITFLPKTELRTCQTSQKTKQFANIELFVPRLAVFFPYRITKNRKKCIKNSKMAKQLEY